VVGPTGDYGEALITASICRVWYVVGPTGRTMMPDESPTASANRELTAEIVAAYLRRNQTASDQLATLISTVHQALAGLGKPPAEAAVERTPAVSIRRSITATAVICLDCGWKGQMLRRHAATAHGLTVEQYRARWNLPHDHALVAPAYSERRSTMAKQFGLGRTPEASVETTAVPEAEAAPRSGRKRRGRSRSAAAPA
jgi:predicted transcriptional regulator